MLSPLSRPLWQFQSRITRRATACPPLARRTLRTGVLLTALALAALPSAGHAATAAATTAPTYVETASRTLGSDVIVEAIIRKSSRISAKQAPDLAPGRQRFLVEAEVVRVLAARQPVPQIIRYLWDVEVAPGGKAPKIRKRAATLFLREVATSDSMYQLVDRDAQFLDAPRLAEIARGIASDPLRARIDAMRIVGILEATPMAHGPAGDRSTTYLLATGDGGTMTATLTTTADGGQRIDLSPPDSLGDGIPVKNDSLAWYVLACGLPEALPESVVDSAARTGDSAQVVADYLQLKRRIGPCQ
ncbi:hypothetical protein [Parapedomonas caeni]